MENRRTEDLNMKDKNKEGADISFYKPMEKKLIEKTFHVEKPTPIEPLDIVEKSGHPSIYKISKDEYMSKFPLEQTPEISQESESGNEGEIKDPGGLKVAQTKQKRNTVVSLVKPKDERRETYKKCLLLNEDIDN